MTETFHRQDWRRLSALRERFLADATADYWKSERELELYDAVYAQRIGWKWDAVLATLDQLPWKPAATKILDWGCGTGIASRRVAQWAGIRNVALFDESRLAERYAAAQHRADGNRLEILHEPKEISADTLLILSHVIGELTDPELTRLLALARQATEIIWVEAGSHELSRKLGKARDALAESGFRLMAPCTHQNACPMFQDAHSGDWCHFFAPPPMDIFQSAFWRRVSETLKIDLRALPYSFLAATRREAPASTPAAERVIGRPVNLKAHCKLLCCGNTGLHERILQKRDAPALYREFSKNNLQGAFVWEFIDPAKGSIRSGTTAFPSES